MHRINRYVNNVSLKFKLEQFGRQGSLFREVSLFREGSFYLGKKIYLGNEIYYDKEVYLGKEFSHFPSQKTNRNVSIYRDCNV